MDIKVKESGRLKLILSADQVLEIKKPKVGALLALDEEMTKAKTEGRGATKAVIEWAVNLGIPREMILDWDEDVFAEVIEDIRDACKKKN